MSSKAHDTYVKAASKRRNSNIFWKNPRQLPAAGFGEGKLPRGAKPGKSPAGTPIKKAKVAAAPVDTGTLDPNAADTGSTDTSGSSGDSGGPSYDVAAAMQQLSGQYDASHAAIGAANNELLARFAQLRLQQEQALSAAQSTRTSDLQSVHDLYAQSGLATDPTTQARLAEQGNRQTMLLDQLGQVQSRSFADRQSAAALINTGALGTLEQQKLAAIANIQAAASGSGGGSGSSGSSGSDLLPAGDATALANVDGSNTPSIGAAAAGYAGNHQGFVNKLVNSLNGDPTRIGPQYAKLRQQLLARAQKKNKKVRGLKKVEKYVVNPIAKIARDRSQQSSQGEAYLRARGY